MRREQLPAHAAAPTCKSIPHHATAHHAAACHHMLYHATPPHATPPNHTPRHGTVRCGALVTYPESLDPQHGREQAELQDKHQESEQLSQGGDVGVPHGTGCGAAATLRVTSTGRWCRFPGTSWVGSDGTPNAAGVAEAEAAVCRDEARLRCPPPTACSRGAPTPSFIVRQAGTPPFVTPWGRPGPPL